VCVDQAAALGVDVHQVAQKNVGCKKKKKKKKKLIRMRTEDFPCELPLILIGGTVVFPGAAVPLTIQSQPALAALETVDPREPLIAVTTIQPNSAVPYSFGVIARIVSLEKGETSTSVVIESQARARFTKFELTDPPFSAVAEIVHDHTATRLAEQLAVKVVLAATPLFQQLGAPPEVQQMFVAMTQASHIADLVIANLDLPLDRKQELLETLDVEARLDAALTALGHAAGNIGAGSEGGAPLAVPSVAATQPRNRGLLSKLVERFAKR
jgi:ATP-dependent Lon protease